MNKEVELELEKELFSFDNKLIVEVEKYKTDMGISYKKLSGLIGIGESTLAEWRGKKYKGNVATLEDKIKKFMGRKKSMIRRIDFVADTFNKRAVFDNLKTVQEFVASANHQDVHESAKIGLIIGRAGLGKTKGVEEYIKTQSNCVMITAENGDTERSIMSKLAEAFGQKHWGTLQILKGIVKEAIKSREMLIIIDEAEHLRPKTIDIVRSTVDGTGTGLILVGTQQLRDKLMSQRAEYEYLYSRIVAVCKVKELSQEDVFKIVSRYLEGEDIEYTEKEILDVTKALHKFSRGSARNLSNLIAMSMKLVKMDSNYKLSQGKLNSAFITKATERILI